MIVDVDDLLVDAETTALLSSRYECAQGLAVDEDNVFADHGAA